MSAPPPIHRLCAQQWLLALSVHSSEQRGVGAVQRNETSERSGRNRGSGRRNSGRITLGDRQRSEGRKGSKSLIGLQERRVGPLLPLMRLVVLVRLVRVIM